LILSKASILLCASFYNDDNGAATGSKYLILSYTVDFLLRRSLKLPLILG